MNEVEGLLWWRLRHRRAGCRYRRQVPIGRYVVDFACLRHRLVIECDGNQHLDRHYDRRRDRDLAARGFRILRIWDWEIVKDLDATVARITQACASSPIVPHEVGEGAPGERQ
jgi:very-short-patch-repair endonuclease